MTSYRVKKSVASDIKQYTMLSVHMSVGLCGVTGNGIELMQTDLIELEKLESEPIVDAAKCFVKNAIVYAADPTDEMKAFTDKAREDLADIMINTIEI